VAGFEQIDCCLENTLWRFDNHESMAQFCLELFGIDKASAEQVLAALETDIGFRHDEYGVQLDWVLRYATATKA